MPVPVPANLRLGDLQPKDAIAAFIQRGLLQPSYAWQDVWQDEHSRAFAVAGVQRLDVLQVFKDELDRALQQGVDAAAFKKALMPQLAAKGFWGNVEVSDSATGETRITRFNDKRLQLIYDVNMRQSAQAGSWSRIARNKKAFPFILYRTKRDEKVRNTHRAWDGLVLPVDHPFWDTHMPMNGWRCRCSAFGISQKDIDRRQALGEKLRFEAPPEQWITYVNPRTGEVSPVPRGIDPGFAHNPGKDRDAALFEASLRKALKSSPLAGAVAVAQATADYPGFIRAATQSFGKFVDAQLDAKGVPTGHAKGELRFIGALSGGVVRALEARNITLSSAVVGVRDADVMHALRAAKDAVPPALYRRLPSLLLRAHALLLEAGSSPPALLYVVETQAADGSVAKLVIQLQAWVKLNLNGDRVKVPVNLVRTVTKMDASALADRSRYELLWGQL